jgi:hypothetical protein
VIVGFIGFILLIAILFLRLLLYYVVEKIGNINFLIIIMKRAFQ